MPGVVAAKSRTHSGRALPCLLLAAVIGALPGCNWLQQQVAGEGFQPWAKEIGKDVRSDKKTSARSSGFFWDSKANEIEESLGGGF